MPLSIINFAVLLNEKFILILGADLINVLTLVVDGSNLDLTAHLLAITPIYLPFSLITISTGGFVFLNSL
jgi:hypothetical protein